MRNKQTFCLLLLIMALSSSCLKEEFHRTGVEGYVTDRITGAPLQNVTVELSYTTDSDCMRASFTQIASVTTDSRGYFKFWTSQYRAYFYLFAIGAGSRQNGICNISHNSGVTTRTDIQI